MYKKNPIYKNSEKLFLHCMNHFGKNVIKGSEVLTYVQSPFAFYCNHFIDDSKKDSPNENIIQLTEKGNVHEDQIVEEEKHSILRALGVEHEDQVGKEYRELIPVNFKITKMPTMRDGFKECLDKMMNKKIKILHNAPLLYLPAHILGKPDTLEKRNGTSIFGSHYYIVKEIKSAKNIQRHHILQAAFYNLMIGRIQHRFPKKFYVINGDQEEQSYLYEKWEPELIFILRHMLEILQRKKIPSALYSNVPYPWSTYGNKMVIKEKGITLISGIKEKRSKTLMDNGFKTINDIAICDIEKLADVPKIGKANAMKFKLHARAIKSNKIIKKTKVNLPTKKLEIFLDFEWGTFVCNHVYLIGMMIREYGKKDRYVSFFGKTGDQIIWRKFLKFMKKQKNYVIYHWTHHEKSRMRKLAKKHKTNSDTIQNLFDNLIDLHHVTTESFVFPTYKNDLKSIANKLEFYWNDPDIHGANVECLYEMYLKTSKKEYLQKILDYNKDDCEATMTIKDWVVKQ